MTSSDKLSQNLTEKKEKNIDSKKSKNATINKHVFIIQFGFQNTKTEQQQDNETYLFD